MEAPGPGAILWEPLTFGEHLAWCSGFFCFFVFWHWQAGECSRGEKQWKDNSERKKNISRQKHCSGLICLIFSLVASWEQMWSLEQCWLRSSPGREGRWVTYKSRPSDLQSGLAGALGSVTVATDTTAYQKTVWNLCAEAHIFSLDPSKCWTQCLDPSKWKDLADVLNLLCFLILNVWHCEKKLPTLCLSPLIGLLIKEFGEEQTVLSQGPLFLCCWPIKILKAWHYQKNLARLGWEKVWPFRREA